MMSEGRREGREERREKMEKGKGDWDGGSR